VSPVHWPFSNQHKQDPSFFLQGYKICINHKSNNLVITEAVRDAQPAAYQEEETKICHSSFSTVKHLKSYKLFITEAYRDVRPLHRGRK